MPIVRRDDWERWRAGLHSEPQGGSFPWRLLTPEGEAVLRVLAEFVGRPKYRATGPRGTSFKWRLPADADEAPFGIACDALEDKGLPRPAVEVTQAKGGQKDIRLRFPA